MVAVAISGLEVVGDGTEQGGDLLGTGLLGAAAAAVLLLLAAVGWIRRMRRPGVAELMPPLYLGMLLVWQPDWSGERLLLPVLPLLLALGADGDSWRVYEPTSGQVRLLDTAAVRERRLAPVLGFDRLHAVLLPS